MNFLLLSFLWAIVFLEACQGLISTGTRTITTPTTTTAKTRTGVPYPMSRDPGDDQDSDNNNNNNGKRFPNSASPHLAIITEPDACDSRPRMEQTLQAIQEAVSTGQVDLVSIRLTPPPPSIRYPPHGDVNDIKEHLLPTSDDAFQVSSLQEQLAYELTRSLVELSRTSRRTFRVVCSSDWVHVALQAKADGIHVKEKDLSRIPTIRKQFTSISSSPSSSLSSSLSQAVCIIGTSAHSVESAVESYQLYQPDYYFVGTCYETASHPEKNRQDLLEGPSLPGQVRRALSNVIIADETVREKEKEEEEDALVPTTEASVTTTTTTLRHRSATQLSSRRPPPPPKILAIGGINESNCHEPVMIHGADGVAVIRAVLAAVDPALVVARMQRNMQQPQQEQ
jgi:thiamine monophosphate synthase